MLHFLCRRLVHTVCTLFIFITITFFILQAMPGDISHLFYGNPKITPEVMESIKIRFGLDKPLLVQYRQYMCNILTGDMGVSFSQYPQPVWHIIKERLPRTLVLFFSSTIVSFYIGFLLGKMIAWRKGAVIDVLATTVGITFWTAFYPLVAFVLIWLFAYNLKLVPLNGFIDPVIWYDAPFASNAIFLGLIWTVIAWLSTLLVVWLATSRWVTRAKTRQAIIWCSAAVLLAITIGIWQMWGAGIYAWDIIRHIMLPVGTLALINFGGIMLLTRDAMLETVREDYITVARAKGLPDHIVRDRYAARTAILPVVTSLALSLGYVVSGGVVTETLFSWPGLGLTLLDASLKSDIPLALGAFIFTGIFVIAAHLICDVLHVVLDPRLRSIKGGIL